MKTKGKHGTRIILYTADPEKQGTLESEYIPDPMDAEQTWPTERKNWLKHSGQ
ncbi:Pre-rRNA-processing protein TSR1-like protein [Formica fusca]